MARSKNPDLIFEDLLQERAKRVAGVYMQADPKAAFFDFKRTPFFRQNQTEPLDLELDRVTLFVTHKCNLLCRYCNGPHMNKTISPDQRREMLNAEISIEQYEKLLEEWAAHGLKHIHFTGGEPTGALMKAGT